jgi:hypothetical protein
MKNIYKSKEYALYRLRARLHFIETSSPVLYEAINEDGTFYCSFFEEKWIKKYEDEGLIVRKADLNEEIRHLQSRIEYYEKLAE